MSDAKPTKRERRAAHEYTKSLNKPGRVGSFAESERDRKTDEKIEASNRKQRYITVDQPMRLPGAALLITIGLFVLWLAVNGDFKRLAAAWNYVRGNTQNIADGTAAASACDPSKGICDYSNLHVANLLTQPDLSFMNPGGLT